MKQSLASKIQAANSVLMANGNLDAIGEFFTSDYVAHLTDEDMTGATVRFGKSSACIGVPFRISRSKSRFSWRPVTALPGNERSGQPTKATSRASLQLVVQSCGAIW
jgi:hypothetical protein